MKNCCKCHTVKMEPHPELLFWIKCSVCGFCELDLESIHPKDHELAKSNPYTKRYPLKFPL